MQSNDDVGKVAAASTHVVAYAVEEFLDELIRGAVAVSVEHGNGKMLSPAHIKAHVGREATLDFCKDIVAKAPDVGDDAASRAATGKKTRRRGDAEDDGKTMKKKKKKKKKTPVESEEEDVEEEQDDDNEDEFGLIDECIDDVKDGAHAEQEDDNGLKHAEDEDYDEF